jgi:hypothetical protein
MYSLTICFGPAATSWAFLFKEKKDAETAKAGLMNRDVSSSVWDDFGQEGFFEKGVIHACTLEDLDLTEQARIERSMVDARAQTKFNVRAKSDPTIQAAMRGPSVISPMGRG